LFFNVRTNRDYLLRAVTKEDKEEWTKVLKANCVNTGAPKKGPFKSFGKTAEEREAEKMQKEPSSERQDDEMEEPRSPSKHHKKEKKERSR